MITQNNCDHKNLVTQSCRISGQLVTQKPRRRAGKMALLRNCLLLEHERTPGEVAVMCAYSLGLQKHQDGLRGCPGVIPLIDLVVCWCLS